MVLLRRAIGCFLLILGSIAEAENLKTNEEQQGIPPLPKEEATQIQAIESTTEENVVVNYEEPSFKNRRSLLNALDLAGYFRVRFNYFNNGHLKTYIPGFGGTSLMPPNLSLMSREKDSAANEKAEDRGANPDQHRYSANMGLRLDPTINVSETVRVKSSLDFFKNMVLGSTPSYLAQYGKADPSEPVSFMSRSQNAPIAGVNSLTGAVAIKRAWAEVDFPVGELRFGRMPFNWGLGILYNSGDDINGDYGDQVDGISFTTRLSDHFITPSYHIAYTGPTVRGGGFFNANNFVSFYLPLEAGQRYPLETGDLTHVFSLTYLKKESDFIANKKREEGRAIFDYGLLASYRHQFLDSQAYAQSLGKINDQEKNVVERNSNVGLGSLWAAFSIGTFHIEAEAAGILGKYRIGEKESDLNGEKNEGNRDIWLLQGGIALESRYGFLNDRLQVGLNSGWASSQEGPGFGIREGSKDKPTEGDPDGRKFPKGSKFKTNFKFNPAYTVDLLLYREVLGGIGSTVYVKPHLTYFFSRNFGVRGDAVLSLAPDKSNTTGNSNWLGVELDASSFIRSESGFYFQLAYGILFPLKGLDHRPDIIGPRNFDIYGDAKIAQTLQAFLGVTF